MISKCIKVKVMLFHWDAVQLVYQTIESVQSIMVECWKKYNDPELEERDKISYLRPAKDCNKAIEEMDNLRQKKYHGSGSSSA
ncbi:MAG: hypothetical protein WCF23_11120 [Candidatus Nitrosopolaris sp.]